LLSVDTGTRPSLLLALYKPLAFRQAAVEHRRSSLATVTRMRSLPLLLQLLVICARRPASALLFPLHNRPLTWSHNQQTRLFSTPEPLVSEGDWAAYLDEENTGLVYYFNSQTGEALWEPPTATFPPVSLAAETRQRAEAKQQEYLQVMNVSDKSTASSSTATNGANGATTFNGDKTAVKEASVKEATPVATTATATATTTTVKPQKKEKKKEESPNWFDSFFTKNLNGNNKPASTTATAVTEPMSVEEDIQEPAVEPEPKSTTKKQAFPMFDSFFKRDKTKNEYLQEIEVDEDEMVTTIPRAKPITIDMAAYVLPHPAKASWGGEDAVFTQGRTFGVFDGVSGAEKAYGVPLYSKTMASELKKMVGNDGLSMQEMINCLTRAAITCDQDSTGATTAIIASISQDGFLRALNLGDSTCMVIRNGYIVSKSKEISHYFDCPYQLSIDSPDRPRDGTKMNIELTEGDLVVMGSDGIFDNMFDEDIVSVINESPKRAQAIAKRLSEQSRKLSLNRKAVTPYSQSAKKYGDPDYEGGVGGKVDDVSCVVVRYG
jgi:protein phosphatase PTC7